MELDIEIGETVYPSSSTSSSSSQASVDAKQLDTNGDFLPRDDWEQEELALLKAQHSSPPTATEFDLSFPLVCPAKKNCPPNAIITDFEQGHSVCTNCGTILPGMVVGKSWNDIVEKNHDDGQDGKLSSTLTERKGGARRSNSSSSSSMEDAIASDQMAMVQAEKNNKVILATDIKKAVDDVVMNVLPVSHRCYFVQINKKQQQHLSHGILALGWHKQPLMLRVPLEREESKNVTPVITDRLLYTDVIQMIQKVVKHRSAEKNNEITGRTIKAYRTMAVAACWQLLMRKHRVLFPLQRLAERAGLKMQTLRYWNLAICKELKLPDFTTEEIITGWTCHYTSFYPYWNKPENSKPSNTDLFLLVQYVFGVHDERADQSHRGVAEIDAIVASRLHALRTGAIQPNTKQRDKERLKGRNAKTYAAVFAYLLLRQRRNTIGYPSSSKKKQKLEIEDFCELVHVKRDTFQNTKRELLQWL
jgi:hypothetical protein